MAISLIRLLWILFLVFNLWVLALCGRHRSRSFLGVLGLFLVFGIWVLECDDRTRVFLLLVVLMKSQSKI